MNVLVVDDDQDQLSIRCTLLQAYGFAAFPALSLAAAMAAAGEHKPTAAVVDLGLPSEEQGLALIRALKRLDPKILLFLLTGSDPAALRDRPERALIDEVFLKGSGLQPLIDRLNAANHDRL
jgi:DNA-binding response OmpR family regulator